MFEKHTQGHSQVWSQEAGWTLNSFNNNNNSNNSNSISSSSSSSNVISWVPSLGQTLYVFPCVILFNLDNSARSIWVYILQMRKSTQRQVTCLNPCRQWVAKLMFKPHLPVHVPQHHTWYLSFCRVIFRILGSQINLIFFLVSSQNIAK